MAVKGHERGNPISGRPLGGPYLVPPEKADEYRDLRARGVDVHRAAHILRLDFRRQIMRRVRFPNNPHNAE